MLSEWVGGYAGMRNLVDYVPINGVRGRLVGLCDTCERPLQRFAKLSALSDFAQFYNISIKNNSQA